MLNPQKDCFHRIGDSLTSHVLTKQIHGMRKLITISLAALTIQQAQAALTFTVDAVSINTITISITDGSTLVGPEPDLISSLLLFDSVSGSNFVTDGGNLGPMPSTAFIGSAFGSPSSNGIQMVNDLGNIGDIVAIGFAGATLSEGAVASGVTFTFTSSNLDFAALPGALTPTDVGADLRLSWGRGPNGPGNAANLGPVQSVGAIPEPAHYAALLGLSVLVLIAWCRHRRV